MEMKNVQTFFCHFDHLFVINVRGGRLSVYILSFGPENVDTLMIWSRK